MFDIYKVSDCLIWTKPALWVGGGLILLFFALANLRRVFGYFNYKERIKAKAYKSSKKGILSTFPIEVGPKPFWGRVALHSPDGPDALRLWILPAGKEEVVIEEDVTFEKRRDFPDKARKNTFLVWSNTHAPFAHQHYRYLVKKELLIPKNEESSKNSELMICKDQKYYTLNIEIERVDEESWRTSLFRSYFFKLFDYGNHRMSWFERAIVFLVILVVTPAALSILIFDLEWRNSLWLLTTVGVALLFFKKADKYPSQKLSLLVEMLIGLMTKFNNS